ncbi:MAG TPA: lytic transglycosylase domain-containing protein [Candidatus Hydrothermia bacterium]|nr:lytic transglycosylase domain-containing protein [Candidatus Hydrothermae bacterium]MDD3649488.1 lytic transglycosylase domain-containing protein [Candidatus Hydrothermia bacterium]MDD5573502.1 lytic transglycosylase domain-containing protein [Candidatus Hydrothermia bacterium]HOK22793.1 lytic transglycosylase domain-containing protein [Candidatus Hydrothermia bacterium]HOL23502.1 lytic transglycosylase domain-containing protein [Candidatus Hydrothermia bacterium]
MGKFLLTLFIVSPIKENFRSRNFWKVLTLKEAARDTEDSILIILSMKIMLESEKVPGFINFSDQNTSHEIRIAATSAIFDLNAYNSVTIRNLELLSDSVRGLEDYFTLKLVEKYLGVSDFNSAIKSMKRIEEKRYRRSALRKISDKVWETRNRDVVDTILSEEDLPKDAKLLLTTLKYLLSGDSSNARKTAEELASSSPKSSYSLKVINLLNDTLKAYVYYSNNMYSQADGIFSKIKTNRYPFAQIVSAYRTKNYKKTLGLYESYRNILKNHEKRQLLLFVGYSYRMTGDLYKALEYLTISANNGNEIAAREVLDILIKEDSLLANDYIKNTRIESQELNYAVGLYFLTKNDTTNAVNYLMNAMHGGNTKIKERATYFLTHSGKNLDDEHGVNINLDYFALLNNGIIVTKEEKMEKWDSTYTENLNRFKYFLLWGDANEALNSAPQNGDALLKAIDIADRLGYDNVKITLAIRYLNSTSSNGIPLFLLEYLFPLNYADIAISISEFYNVKPEITLALIREESRFDPHAISPAGAVGLMQLMPSTAKKIMKEITPDSLRIPDLNLTIGIKYFSSLLGNYPNLIHALCSYNAGESRIKEWVSTYIVGDPLLFMELIPFKETREYVQRIMRSIIIYQYLLKEKA